jgi:hypothetical protein
LDWWIVAVVAIHCSNNPCKYVEEIMRSVITFLILCVFLLACSSGKRLADEPVGGKTVVRVENRNFYDMTIYVISSGSRVRLGTVTGNRTEVFIVPEYILTGPSTIRFLVDPIGGRRTPISQEMSVIPGEEIELIIPSN